MWEVTSALINSEECQRKLESGWEPFAVVRKGNERSVMWFRRLLGAATHAQPRLALVGRKSEPKMLTIKNAENSHKVIVIEHDEDKPLASIMPGEKWIGEPRLLILPKTGRVHLSIDHQELVTTTDLQQIPGTKNDKGVFSTINGQNMRWTDAANLTHKVEGSDIHQGVRLLWTKCERDVPAGEAFLHTGWDGPFDMCPVCASAK